MWASHLQTEEPPLSLTSNGVEHPLLRQKFQVRGNKNTMVLSVVEQKILGELTFYREGQKAMKSAESDKICRVSTSGFHLNANTLNIS